MSTIKTNTLTGTTSAGSILVTGEGGVQTTNLQQGLTKCWLHYAAPSTSNGQTISTEDSFALTSTVDNGDGQVMINMANPMANATYVLLPCGQTNIISCYDTDTMTTAQVRMETYNHTGYILNSLGMASIQGDLA